MRFRYALAALLLIPLADALLLVVVADYIGWEATVLLVVLTGLVGMLLVRAEGRHTMGKLQRKLAVGQAPTTELLDGAFLIAAGAFLLTPGVVTDAIGFLFAIPLTRYPIRELLKRHVVVPYADKRMDGFVTGTVWTGGFPQDEGGGPTGPGAGPNRGSSPDGDPGSSGGDDVVDVDEDDYSVDDNR